MKNQSHLRKNLESFDETFTKPELDKMYSQYIQKYNKASELHQMREVLDRTEWEDSMRVYYKDLKEHPKLVERDGKMVEASLKAEVRKLNSKIVHSQKYLLSSKQRYLFNRYFTTDEAESYKRIAADYGEEVAKKWTKELREGGLYGLKDPASWIAKNALFFLEEMYKKDKNSSWNFIFNS